MQISERERRVIVALEQCAAEPLGKVARRVGMREHTLRYLVQRLRAEGLLSRPIALIDCSRIGLQEHTLYLSVAAARAQARARLLEMLRASKEVSWLAEAGGEYQYFAALCTRSVFEVGSFLDRISDSCGDIVLQKPLAVMRHFSSFGRKFLAPDTRPPTLLSYTAQPKMQMLDASDTRILSLLATEASNASLAASVGLSESACSRRIRALEEAGVIVGYFCRLQGARLGLQVYKLLVHSRGTSEKFRKEFRSFCARHPHIVTYMETIGAWDFELRLETEASASLPSISRELFDAFPEQLLSIEVVPIAGFLKAVNFAAG